MKLSNFIIPFDAYERNKKISTFVNSKDSVLDVGGGATGIKLFTDGRVTIVDLEVGDIKKDARKLKLPNESYDVVTCVDTLEHIPPRDRRSFVRNLITMAKKKVIISAPYGSSSHKQAEKKLLLRLRDKGVKDYFLSQHVEYGLPSPEDVLVKKAAGEVFYSGDYRVSNLLFRIQSYQTGVLVIDKLLLLIRSAMNVFLNILVYPIWFYKKERVFANRFYVVINK